ncbi:MAG: DNA-deoxyinosine glycosylase [Coriobacteriaceae bacterium]|nr:DNA-deoxyinosine glycosylase [Coriobacteriaceae bacterium]
MEAAYQHISHGFEPLFDERSRVLVLGSIPSVLSRANAFYYGNPQNRFWRMMAACLDEPFPESNDAKRTMLLGHGIALWDAIASCDIQGSSDASIKNAVPTDLSRIFDVASIEAVLCNGAASGRLYRRHQQARIGLAAEVLPSTSPANAAWSLDRLVERWGAVLRDLGVGPAR